jgi:predicted dehydrogenase
VTIAGKTNGQAHLRIAVVGCGYWGSKHLRVLTQVADVGEIVAVDSNLERAEALARSFPRVRAYPDITDIVDEVDAIVIATPASTHHKIALHALEAGKAVLIEKPMSTTSADAMELRERADAAGSVLMVGHTFEFNAAVQHLRSLIDGGELGRIYYMDSARLNLGMYQPDVNVIWDLAPHDVSIANYLLRSTPSTVQAWGNCSIRPTIEDVAYIRLAYEDVGVTAQIHVSWLDPMKVRRTTIVGSKRMAVYDDLAAEERVRVFDKGLVQDEQQPGVPMSYRYGGITSPYIAFEEPLLVQDSHFVDCVIGRDVPLVDGDNGLAVVRVLEAAQEALRTGETVRLYEPSTRPELALVTA